MAIKTPEGVIFSLLLASPVTRFLAWAIDFAIITFAVGLTGNVMMLLNIFSADIARGFYIISYFIVSIGYGIALERYMRGQTLGKRLLGLRVMDSQGLHLNFSQIVIRNLLRFVDSLPSLYLVGGVVCLLSKQAQRLGDIAAGTIVVRYPKLAEPNLDQILADKYNSFNQYPHLEARLRQMVTPGQASIALQALLRRNELEPESRIGLYRAIADNLQSLVEFPQEVTEGLSDEQYIRNCVDVLFRAKVTDI